MRRPCFSAVLLIALMCRALVPVGYMPGIGLDGAFTVMLCPGYAPVLAQTPHDDSAHPGEATSMADMPDMAGMADMPGTVHPGHSQHETQGNCPYAGATMGMVLAHLASALLLGHQPDASVVFPPERHIPRGTIVPTRLPRGPPIEV